MSTWLTHLTSGLYLLLMGLLSLTSCANDEPPAQGPRSLVTPEAWRLVESTRDPWTLPGDQPSDCPDATFYLEDGVLEIDTNQCAHITLEQPSLSPVNPGESVRVSLYHQNLWSPTAFDQEEVATVAVRVGEHQLFTETIPIPQPARPISHSWVSPGGIPLGTPVHAHISNHGTNTWYLYEIAVESSMGHDVSPD